MIRLSLSGASIAALAISVALAPPAFAQREPLSIRNTFRIGNAGVLCTAQVSPLDKRLNSISCNSRNA